MMNSELAKSDYETRFEGVSRKATAVRCSFALVVLALAMPRDAVAQESPPPSAAPSPLTAPPPAAAAPAPGTALQPVAKEAMPVATASSATGPAPPAGPEPHDAPAPVVRESTEHRHLGFYFRGEVGGGAMRSSTTISGSTAALSGGNGLLSLAFGGAVAENFIIAGEAWLSSAIGPELTYRGQTATSTSDVSMALRGIGPSFTYYLMPANVYATVTPSLVSLSLRNTRTNEESGTKVGFGTRLSIGKEWWVASHLGIGVSGNFHLGVNPEELTANGLKTSYYWTSLAGGVAFSFTHN